MIAVMSLPGVNVLTQQCLLNVCLNVCIALWLCVCVYVCFGGGEGICFHGYGFGFERGRARDIQTW